MGDNRTVNGSEDSRSFGTVPLADLAGRATYVVWPLQRPKTLGYNCAASTEGTPSPEREGAVRALPVPAAFSDLSRALSE